MKNDCNKCVCNACENKGCSRLPCKKDCEEFLTNTPQSFCGFHISWIDHILIGENLIEKYEDNALYWIRQHEIYKLKNGYKKKRIGD